MNISCRKDACPLQLSFHPSSSAWRIESAGVLQNRGSIHFVPRSAASAVFFFCRRGDGCLCGMLQGTPGLIWTGTGGEQESSGMVPESSRRRISAERGRTGNSEGCPGGQLYADAGITFITLTLYFSTGFQSFAASRNSSVYSPSAIIRISPSMCQIQLVWSTSSFSSQKTRPSSEEVSSPEN